MTPSHEDVLREVWGYLEERLALAGAVMVAALSREQEVPTPAVVLGLGSWTRSQPEGAIAVWELTATVLGADAFEVARVLDALEAACNEWRQSGTPGGSIRAVRYAGHEEIDLDVGRLAARALIEVHLVRR